MKFKELPAIVKIAIVLTFFKTWVMFEEFVIDRFGYWKYLPFYKKGIFCTLDLTFIVLVSFLIFANLKFIKSKCFISKCTICH